MTLSIAGRQAAGFSYTERHISWLELSEKREQIRIVPPAPSISRQFRFTHPQRFRFHLQVTFGIDVRCVDGDVPKPCADCVDIDSCSQQVGRGGVANRVWAYPFVA